MGCLSCAEKDRIRKLFDISNGYVFNQWYERQEYDQTKTREILLNTCGIDICSDTEYCCLSQQKCVEKIWDEESPQKVAKILSDLCEYFYLLNGDDIRKRERHEFQAVQNIIKRLKTGIEINLPDIEDK